MSARTDELRRQVSVAKAELQQAERWMNEYARNYHLSKTILAQREEQLAFIEKLEADEGVARADRQVGR